MYAALMHVCMHVCMYVHVNVQCVYIGSFVPLLDEGKLFYLTSLDHHFFY